jgi:superfamily II DNA/RNA helicase
VSTLARDRDLGREFAQFRAHATLLDLLGRAPDYRWNYRLDRLIRNAVALHTSLRETAQQSGKDDASLQEDALLTARLWEAIARNDQSPRGATALANSAMQYELAGYQANSLCLARELTRRLSTVEGDNTALAAVSTFLERRFIRLLTAPVPDQPLADAPIDEWAFRAASAITLAGVRAAALYFLSGGDGALDTARGTLGLAQTTYASLGDAVGVTMLSDLRAMVEVMQRRSTWAVLQPLDPSPRWQRYIRLLARGAGSRILNARGVTELWPSQLTALDAGLLSADRVSTIVRMPTSAGKTRVAEMAIVRELARDPNARCLYLAPFRALANEVVESISSVVSDLGFGVRSMLGAYERDAADSSDIGRGEVLVITPEKADLLLRMSARSLLDDLALVIVDEGHLVADEARGPRFELFLSRLRRSAPDARFIFLSAVIADSTLRDFADWLGRGTGKTAESTWRPSLQRVAQLEWTGRRGTLRYVAAQEDTALGEFVPSLVVQSDYDYVNPQSLRVNRRVFPVSTHRGQVAAEAAFQLAPQGPVLIFCATRTYAEACAQAVGERIALQLLTGATLPDIFQERDSTRSLSFARDWLGETHWLTSLLRRGIGVHHADVPEPVRLAIEDDLRQRRIGVICATTTLAQGVNFPVRTVIFHSTSRYDPDARRPIRLEAREYWNIAGRAGRAGEETEGTVIHLVFPNSKDQRDFQYYLQHRSDVEPIRSALFTLLEEIAANRLTVSGAADRLDSEVLGLIAEEVELSEGDVAGLLDDSLVRVQAQREQLDLEPLRLSFRAAADRVVASVPDANTRQLFGSTGFKLASCLAMQAHIESHRHRLQDLLTGAGYEEALTLLLLLIEGLTGVEELEPKYELGVGTDTLAPGWIAGQSPVTLAGDLGIDVDRLSAFLQEYFGYLLPWGISGYTVLAAGSLDIDALSAVASNLSTMVRYGVPTIEAAWAMAAGVPARSAAIALGAEYTRQDRPTSASAFRQWLASLPLDDIADWLGVDGSTLDATSRAIIRATPNPLLEVLTTRRSPAPFDTTIIARTATGQAASAALRYGTDLNLVRDYASGINRNSIYVEHSGQRIGYLDRNASQALAPDMDAGWKFAAQVLEVTTEPMVAIKLRVTDPTDADASRTSR